MWGRHTSVQTASKIHLGYEPWRISKAFFRTSTATRHRRVRDHLEGQAEFLQTASPRPSQIQTMNLQTQLQRFLNSITMAGSIWWVTGTLTYFIILFCDHQSSFKSKISWPVKIYNLQKIVYLICTKLMQLGAGSLQLKLKCLVYTVTPSLRQYKGNPVCEINQNKSSKVPGKK